MGAYGGFYKGDKKKKKKEYLARLASQITNTSSVPKVEIIGKGKKNK